MRFSCRQSFVVLCAAWAGISCAADGEPAVRLETVNVPMRDGVMLSTDIYRNPALGKAPVLLMRTPYGKGMGKAAAERFVAAGYVAVVQGARGRAPSEGVFMPYNHEGQDGYDAIEWIGRQPWSSGRVGTWGGSYVGAVQWQAAVERPPGLVVMAPTYTWNNFYRNLYLGGAVRLSLLTKWAASMSMPPDKTAPAAAEWDRKLMHLPLSDFDRELDWPAPWLTSLLTHPNPNGYWSRLDLTDKLPTLDVAAQHIVGYYDFFSREAVAGFLQMQAHARSAETRRRQQLILGPWEHGPTGSTTGEVDFGPAAAIDLTTENLKWFERFLRRDHQDAVERFAPVRYFVMGANVWRESGTWPPAGCKPAAFYLHSKGRANSLNGDGRLARVPPAERQPADSFRADPADPAPANPVTPTRALSAAVWGPVDQRRTEEREDVLVYTSEPMAKPLTFAGNVHAELSVSADTPDADWVVKLIDVRPDGFAQNLAVGVIRGSFRDSELQPTPLLPGRIYQVAVDLGPVAAQLGVGHRLRIDVSGAYFPLFDRNTNTAEGPFGQATRIATAKVHHDKDAVSRLLLPVSIKEQ